MVVKPHLAHWDIYFFLDRFLRFSDGRHFYARDHEGIGKKRGSQCRVRMQGRNWPRSDGWAPERRLVIEPDPKELRSDRFLIKICVARVAQACLLRSSDLSRSSLLDVPKILSRLAPLRHRLTVCVLLCILCLRIGGGRAQTPTRSHAKPSCFDALSIAPTGPSVPVSGRNRKGMLF